MLRALFLAVAVLAATPAAAGTMRPNDLHRGPALSQHFGAENCRRTAVNYAKDPGSLKPRKLTELPPGNMYVAVFRHDVNGCEVPIVVKYGVGRR